MKIGVISDIHSNKEALEIALDKLSSCDEIICLGDLCHFGADINECFDIISNLPNFYMVKGNHDQYYIYCYENKVLNGLASEFIEYINFMKENTNPRVYGFLKGLPYSLTRNINGKKLTFKHFAWKEDLSDTESLAVCPPRQEQIESLFKDVKSQYVFYGHTHFQHSINIKKEHMTRWYINFGPLGTPHANQGIAKFGSVEIDECGEVIINNYALDYDVTKTKSKIASLDNSYVGKIIDKFFSN